MVLTARGFPLLLLLFYAAGSSRGLRGGSKKQRDRWYGLETQEGFADFRRWWHREGKHAEMGKDIADAPEARRIFAEWENQGRPKGR
jgi:hypothetical protein